MDDSLNGRVKVETWRDMTEERFIEVLDKKIDSMRWSLIFLRRDMLKDTRPPYVPEASPILPTSSSPVPQV